MRAKMQMGAKITDFDGTSLLHCARDPAAARSPECAKRRQSDADLAPLRLLGGLTWTDVMRHVPAEASLRPPSWSACCFPPRSAGFATE